MSCDPDRVAAAIETALLAAGASSETPKTAELAVDLAAAVLEEVLENAVVPGPALAAPPSGGPVTGASTITELDADRLAGPIKAALLKLGTPDELAEAAGLALATAYVDEISDHAVVSGTGLAASNTPASPGVVTGTAAITGLNPVRLAVPIRSALVNEMRGADNAGTSALALALATAVTAELLLFAGVVPVPPLAASAGGGPLVGVLEVT